MPTPDPIPGALRPLYDAARAPHVPAAPYRREQAALPL